MNFLDGLKTHLNFKLIRAGGGASGQEPIQAFHSDHYLRHNARRLEHLASLRIPVSGMSVLEVGAGIGDHSHYYIDRGCEITITDRRAVNIQHLRSRYPHRRVQFLDLDAPTNVENTPFDVVHCYGLLYHLKEPELALEFLSKNTRKLMFLETCVSFGEDQEINLVSEVQPDPTQAYSGTGCRPTRAWLLTRLQNLFEYVYLPKTQPWHEEFPLDWTAPQNHKEALQRAVFVASHERLENELLTTDLIPQQTR